MNDRPILKALLSGNSPVLADGAMGTMLHRQGIEPEACFDELNLTDPGKVAEVHRAYIEAGAQIIETNTFGANSYKLAAYGLRSQVREINLAAAELARRVVEASFEDVIIAGSVGPLGVRLAPYGRVTKDQACAAYSEQITSLVDGQVDMLIIETQTDLREALQAIRAAQQVSKIPVMVSVTFTRDDHTQLGDSPSQVAQALHESGASIIGANCSGGPVQLLRIIEEMHRAVPKARLGVMPNAGWPEQLGGRIMYPATADYFSEFATAFSERGVCLIGGCCGTTPEHIASLRSALDNHSPPPPHLILPSPSRGSAGTISGTQETTEFASRLAQGRFVISVEVSPPRGFSPHKLLAGANLLAEAGADVINVADSPLAQMRMSPWAVCELIQRQVGIESTLHFPTRGRNLLRVQGDLLGAHALGVRNVFVVMGDPTSIGDYPEAMDDYDLVPTGLIRLIKHNFNSGVDLSGADIGGSTSFFVGCALNLNAKNVDREVQLLRKKLNAGAEFALTQPVFDPTDAVDFLHAYEQQYGRLEVPILAGVLPLYNDRHASFLHHEVPGVLIPEEIRKRISQAGQQSQQEGVRLATELIRDLRGIVQGVYLMPPFSRFDIAAEVIERARDLG